MAQHAVAIAVRSYVEVGWFRLQSLSRVPANAASQHYASQIGFSKTAILDFEHIHPLTAHMRSLTRPSVPTDHPRPVNVDTESDGSRVDIDPTGRAALCRWY